MAMREMHLKRRWFNYLMRHILVCACARRIKAGVKHREEGYLRRVAFLALKQEMVVKKEVREMLFRREASLKRKVLMSFKKNAAITHLSDVIDAQAN